MKIFQTLAEGGQTWAHRVRMVKQVFKIAITFSFTSIFVYFFITLASLNPLMVKSGYYYLKAEVLESLAFDKVSVSAKFWKKITQEKSSQENKIIPIDRLKRATYYRSQLLNKELKAFVFSSLKIGFIAFGALLLFFFVRGSASKRKHHIAGKKRIRPLFLLLNLTIRKKASNFKIGNIPLIKGTETQHILVSGGTGSGKTNCFHHILPQIRTKGQKAIVIDTSGVFIERYFDSKKDILLNPFDSRSASWHPWIECEDSFDYDNLAESIIPQTYNDYENYWRSAARSLLSSSLKKISNNKTSELTKWLLFQPLDLLAQFVQDTQASAHIDVRSEKTAASVRSVAASFLGFLDYIKDTDNPFSVKKWLQSDVQDSWLFLATRPAQRATLNPLIACWFSIAVRSLLQMPQDLDRRTWFIIDELPILQKLKDLDSLVTESRKYGGCGLLALQSPSQLEEIYGRALAQTIIGNCATRVIFAEHDPEVAEKISKTLGESEIKEYQEGISYGDHEVRDGVSLSLQKKKIPVVSSNDIQSLENNQAFIKLPGNTPISKIRLKIK